MAETVGTTDRAIFLMRGDRPYALKLRPSEFRELFSEIDAAIARGEEKYLSNLAKRFRLSRPTLYRYIEQRELIEPLLQT